MPTTQGYYYPPPPNPWSEMFEDGGHNNNSSNGSSNQPPPHPGVPIWVPFVVVAIVLLASMPCYIYTLRSLWRWRQSTRSSSSSTNNKKDDSRTTTPSRRGLSARRLESQLGIQTAGWVDEKGFERLLERSSSTRSTSTTTTNGGPQMRFNTVSRSPLVTLASSSPSVPPISIFTASTPELDSATSNPFDDLSHSAISEEPTTTTRTAASQYVTAEQVQNLVRELVNGSRTTTTASTTTPSPRLPPPAYQI